ncbi:glycosyltransferase family 15 protein [Mycena sp. CBHHK59/15]|nr:glycosyltransferase family 15 protein [Mycena sp. CBHHK59/15]
MMTRTRYVVLALAIIISLHYILSFSHEGYSHATSLDTLKGQLPWRQPPPEGTAKVWHEPPYKTPVPDKYYLKPNATMDRKASAVIVLLARNGDLGGIVKSVSQLENKFNHKFGYPYVFLNEEPFTDEFKRTVKQLTDADIQFGLIPHDHWYQPASIDEAKAAASRKNMEENHVIYGGAVPYRNMCRFNSGFFYRHELLKPYRYYWRCANDQKRRPDVKFFCDLDYDPFLFMQDEGKKYGFTISLPEYELTIPTLWDAVKEFIRENPTLISPDNAMGFLSDDAGESYNKCHFWSNFEIADLDLWRSEPYSKFFDFLDSKGGFYYERWGDAPVHSIGAALFARKDQIHFFEDIGYRHEPFQHCPQGAAHTRGRCECDVGNNFDREGWSCLNRYDRIFT